MIKNYMFIIMTVCSLLVKAQFTLTSASLPLSGDFEIRHYTTNTVVPLGSSGSGQTWNYTMLDVSWNSYMNNYVSMSSVANGSLYPLGTLGSYLSPGYCRVFENTVASSKVIGESAPTASSCAFYSNPKTLMNFPFSFGTVINDTYAYSDPGSSNVGTITISGDGIGTLLTPGKTFTNVLKVRYNYTEVSTVASITYTTIAIEEFFYNSTNKFPLLTIGNSTNTASNNTIVSISNWAQINETGYLNINETGLMEDFKVFPNPTSANRINIHDFKSEILSISIINALGQNIKTISIDKTNRNETLNLDINDLSKGLYYLQLLTKEATKTQKIIIE